jgi:hypothetical protein
VRAPQVRKGQIVRSFRVEREEERAGDLVEHAAILGGAAGRSQAAAFGR